MLHEREMKMPQNIEVYDLLISCPSDVSHYLDVIEKEILRFNNFFGRFNNIIIRTRHWSKDAFSELGNGSQQSLNKQIVDSSDLALGVFWTRFGTPTENYGSGTEEEIERMISMKKQVFLYFLDKPINPSMVNQRQYNKINKFMKKHKNDGIYFVVQDENALLLKIRENMELYFNSLVRGEEFKKIYKINNILWVDDRPENNVFERKTLERYGFDFSLALSTQQALDLMKHKSFSLIISDMGRKEGSREGYVLLDEVRKTNKTIPFIIYAGSKKREHINETFRHGGQGCTNNPLELINLVLQNLKLNNE